MDKHAQEISNGQRFGFGKNWSKFLSVLNDERISQAEISLRNMLGIEELTGKTFLDIGSGSGLFSLAARRLGAKVHSFDYDPQSVNCAIELKRRFFDNDSQWTIERGSALDTSYLKTLGKFDIVYSWGVLHHTGNMWDGLNNAVDLVNSGGLLFIAIYNNQGTFSRFWLKVKKIYNALPSFLQMPFAFLVLAPRELKSFLFALLILNPRRYSRYWTHYSGNRGMSRLHDMIDWIGGYPFEVAKPEEIFDFCSKRGFTLDKLKTCAGGVGCNEFVLRKVR